MSEYWRLFGVKNRTITESADTKSGWSDHEIQQILSIARDSTPEQRFRKLEELIDLLRPHLLKHPRRDND